MSTRGRSRAVGPALLVTVAGWLAVVAMVGSTSHSPDGAAPASPVPAGASVDSTARDSRSGPARTDVPILLVPGWLDTARDLAALRIRFLAAGWSRVQTLTFRDPTGSNREHALEIDSVVAEIRSETGAAAVDVIAHSMGGLATRWYLLTRSPTPVRRVAFLGSPHRGTLAAHLAWGAGGDEMTPGSPFLDTLNEAPSVPVGLEAITIRTPLDTRVVPGENATLPGVPDYTVCCPTHTGLLRDDEVFRIVLDFLEYVGAAPAAP